MTYGLESGEIYGPIDFMTKRDMRCDIKLNH